MIINDDDNSQSSYKLSLLSRLESRFSVYIEDKWLNKFIEIR